MQDLTQEEWHKKIIEDANGVILDVRTPHEVEEGIIPNAQVLNIQNAPAFMEGAQELDKTKNYYVYCRSGGRSAQACMIMESLGFQNTFNLLGGFSEWTGDKTVSS
ncbi:MAG TPA: rhodanese-like domain-containing protein [Flavobacteriaceae bacterium]|nr:rhodanese [Flavobacteriaceae bacterium]MAY52456.1 rhodanese [Flavobacteriaceae bacterium]HBR52653.1 rhodanese-like domain-containing protein [Flavobacteriaceae bacterium]|tara:strand:+ start:753 stop:1070 length:318 start_codon:yes stop_codon:yes gene_type:complete